MAYARLGPSNHRWVHCPGSVREEAGYEDVAGAAAIDGTGSHELLELCLINGVRAESYIGHVIAPNHPDSPMGWMVSDDRATRVQQCLDYVARRKKELTEIYPTGVITVEAESHSNPGHFYGRDDWWGTVDITITVRVDEVVKFIEICDYKDGRGWVDAKNNSQLLSYLGGKAKEYDQHGSIDGYRTSIVQPKTNPPIRYHDYLPNAAMGIVDGLAVAARKTDDPDAPLVSGKHCQWCKANQKRGGHCTVESQKSIEVVNSMTNLITTDGSSSLYEMFNNGVGDVTKIDSIKLSEFASAKDGIMAVFEKFEAEIERRILENNEKVPGYAVKPGRNSKVWNEDEEAIEKMLKGRRLTKDDIYPRKLISPAQVLKHSKLTDAQRTAIQKKYISEKAGAMKLTRVAHGEEVNAEEMFKDIVAQSDTPVVQSPVSMFDDVKSNDNEEVSFF